jgi:hypothetical protein
MQLGTHLDALSHLQMGGYGYNGWSVTEHADVSGVRRLGIETAPQIVTRGLLVDKLRGRQASSAPARATAKALGIKEFEDGASRPRGSTTCRTGAMGPAGA